MTPLDPEMLRVCIADYEAGSSLATIGREHGIPQGRLRAALSDAGVAIRPGHVRESKAKPFHDEIVKRYRRGVSMREIGTQLGLSRSVIENYVASNAASFPPRERPTVHAPGGGSTPFSIDTHPKLLARVIEIYTAGRAFQPAVAQANAEHGTTFYHSTVRDALRRAGLHPNWQPKPAATDRAPEPKNEVVFGDLVIRKTTRMVPAGKAFSLDGVSMVPVSLSAGARWAA